MQRRAHLIHGFLFYAAAWGLGRAVGRPIPFGWALLLAILVECAWEIAENTDAVIGRYREATIALGYSGDSILNSVSDILMMVVGFLLARRLPVWLSVLVAIAVRTALRAHLLERRAQLLGHHQLALGARGRSALGGAREASASRGPPPEGEDCGRQPRRARLAATRRRRALSVM